MAELTVGRMAKLYGLHRSTLYEAIEKGRVTAGFNGKGQRVVSLAEMIRVYGEAPSDTRHPTPSRPTAKTAPDTSALVDELRALREEVRQLREQMQRLPPPIPPEPPTAPPQQPQEPKQGNQPPKTLADVLARFEGR